MTPRSHTSLFPSPEERLRIENELTELLIQSQRRLESGRVTPSLNASALRRRLSRFDFASPQPLQDVLEWTGALLEQGVVQITHPKYFGLFNPKPTFPAEAADRIAGAFNPQLASAKTSPAAVEIEAHTIRALAERAGLPAGTTGHFTSGGSEANFTATVCALVRASAKFVEDGARAFDAPLKFYVSRESHLAWLKIAVETGIGRNAVRLVNTDGTGRLCMKALQSAIDADRARGSIPFMAVATAGTTGAGMIDPLMECADVARNNGLWYHVDAAWGGAAAISGKLRGVLAGLELADSITIDAHKWFATTMGCGMIFTRHPSIFEEAFDVATHYMPSHDSHDPYVTSAQWSRRFLGLRLFLGLATAGWTGYAEHIERSVQLASYAKKVLLERGWRVANDSQLAVVCLLPPGDASPERIVEKIVGSGKAWVSVATYEGQRVIRLCVTNGTSTEDDVDVLAGALDWALKETALSAAGARPDDES
jgi:glutamate/tyrosine decarboxylase-like PLP-dependent enzyme